MTNRSTSTYTPEEDTSSQNRPQYIAHIRRDESGDYCQSLTDHNRNAAAYAKEALSEVNLSSSAYLAGLLHDAGKATQSFQTYLHDAVFDGTVARGSVNHTFAAVRFLLTRYHDEGRWGSYAPLTSELLAYADGAHHGLFDCVDVQGKSGFQHRLVKENIGYEESIAGFLNTCAGYEEIDKLFSLSVQEIEAFFKRFLSSMETEPSYEEHLFFISLLSRLLSSAVIEGDRRDTAEFMNSMHFPSRMLEAERKDFWRTLSNRVDVKLDALRADTVIAKARRNISKSCRDFASHPSGIYRLNVPTGSGKTLSSLRFALAHAACWGKIRIIFTSPLLSILDQNAKVIREYVQDDSAILEHHSNVVHSKEQREAFDMAELLAATWDAPVIITTLVQLLNTMFDGSGSCIRRFHSLCNSVIVIDEVQTVPGHLLTLFNLSISFLVKACHATVVLCSATQPCSEEADHPIVGLPMNMVEYDPNVWKAFERTYLEDSGSMSLDDIPMLAAEALSDADSLLIVCNKKSEAESLYKALPDTYDKFHLSAAMCMNHRRAVLDALQIALARSDKNRKVVCVSTQVIEAGVDISFARVIRLAAGMDSMVQSAGRCNRNGESEQSVPVYLVQCRNENLGHLPEIQRAKDATLELLAEYRKKPEFFSNSLASDASIRYFYSRLYKAMPQGLQDGMATIDEKKSTLFSLISDNHDFTDSSLNSNYEFYCLRQAFKSAGQCFAVYDNTTTDVLVPYGKGKKLIADLLSLSLPQDFSKMEELLVEAKSYSVSLYEWQRQQLDSEHALISLFDNRVLVLQEGYYSDELGFRVQRDRIDLEEV